MSRRDTRPDICAECENLVPEMTITNARSYVPGLEREVPLYDGRQVRYVNLDNAATTPPLKPVLDCLSSFSNWYSSVHRGSGYKSLLSTHTYDKCREVVADFIGADLSHHALIFVQNATHGLNKLAGRICLREGQTILTTAMEHHSNLLPWQRLPCNVEYVDVNLRDGTLDMDDMERKIRKHRGELKLVSVTAASNVTGVIPPVRRIARLAHENGAMVAVDATQLVPHRPLHMGNPDDPERIDFAAFSAHKMYAPFGSGVLVGPHEVFENGPPDMVGGGTVEAVTLDDTIWAEPPEREEAGTPNLLGAVALATAARALQKIGMHEVAAHERVLTRHALRRLERLDGLTLYGQENPELQRDRIGVIAMNAPNLSHGKLAAALGYEWGIGVRNGCFCAQPYVRNLLGVSDEEMMSIVNKLAAGDHATVAGMVRLSLGIYNNKEDVDRFVDAIEHILENGPRADYVVHPEHHDYVPADHTPRYEHQSPL